MTVVKFIAHLAPSAIEAGTLDNKRGYLNARGLENQEIYKKAPSYFSLVLTLSKGGDDVKTIPAISLTKTSFAFPSLHFPSFDATIYK